MGRILIDVTQVNKSDYFSGIQRVVNCVSEELYNLLGKDNVEFVTIDTGRLVTAVKYKKRMV